MSTEIDNESPGQAESTQAKTTANAGQPDSVEPSGSQELGGLQSVLREMRRRFRETEERIGDYLEDRKSRGCDSDQPINDSGGKLADGIAELAAQMTEIRQRLDRTPTGSQADVQVPQTDGAVAQSVDEIKTHQLKIANHLAKIIQAGFDKVTVELEEIRGDISAPAEEDPEASEAFLTEEPHFDDGTNSEAGDVAWMEAVFGADLADDPDLSLHMEQLRERLLAGDSKVGALAGHLMVFASAVPERRPLLLKDLGEAYYRCCPKTGESEDVLETALAASLQRTCERAGFHNTIELVRPGDRFDAARHSPIGKGGREVTQPHGWVVLRDNGKVYTKASVAVD